ncbi:nicotinate-nucleotide adenylyltransferase [Vibrio stylophorae]|uniref:nicotinate-nucleotide adenylyltransferase n=1 Tax=Vibrio stylophorae TaxID=659351 RepID=A0ABN8DVK9_9VIBR|nr:nicotinate-nucleotide adenylyltransferase [Vibrio stylophorae]
MKIAVFGSAFNPPTRGHLSTLARLTHFDQVLLVPSFSHAWGKSMLPFATRCELVSCFIEDAKLTNLSLCTLEQTLGQSGDAVTTYALFSALELQYPDAELTFVLGPDNLLNFSKFYQSEAILKRWSILCSPETLTVRSTQVREAILAGQDDLSPWLTPSVAAMVKAMALYLHQD